MICRRCKKEGMTYENPDGTPSYIHAACGYFHVIDPGKPKEDDEELCLSRKSREYNIDSVDPGGSYTTSEIGKFCGYTSPTITVFITRGELKGYKTHRVKPNGKPFGGRTQWTIKGEDYIKFAAGFRI